MLTQKLRHRRHPSASGVPHPKAGLIMKYLTLLLLVVLTTGCITTYTPTRDTIVAKITLVDDINGNPKQLGEATCNLGVCDIKIRRDSYPACITHEIRHGFEGLWHDDRPNTEDCFTE